MPTAPFGSRITENFVAPFAATSIFTAVPRMPIVATGVSTEKSPVFAARPATRPIAPLRMLKKALLAPVPPEA